MKNQSDKEGKSNRYFQVMKKRYVLSRHVARNLQWGAVTGRNPRHSKPLCFWSKNNVILGLF